MALTQFLRASAALGKRRIAAVALAASFVFVAGCGGASMNSRAKGEREADAALLNSALARELATIDAYGHAVATPGGRWISLMRVFRAQDQEHADVLMKAIRGFGATVDGAKARGERQALNYAVLKSRADYLGLLYRRESKGYAGTLNAVAKLTTAGTRSLLGSIGANQAEHLVLLRQVRGLRGLSAVPSAFATGSISPAK